MKVKLMTKKKKLLWILCFLGTLLWANPSEAVFDFDVTFCSSGCDYTTGSTAENALDNAGNITDTTTKCGAWDTQGGSAIADAAAVTWDAGASSGTIHHMTDAGSVGEYMLEVAVGTLDDNDIIDDGGGNTITVNGAPDTCSVTINCAENTTFTSAAITIDGFTTDSDNKVYLSVAEGFRHNGTSSTGCKLSGGNATVSLSDKAASVHWFIITCSQTNAANLQCISMSNAFGNWEMYVDNVIVEDCVNSDATGVMHGISTAHSANTGNPTNYVANTIVDSCDGSGINMDTGASGEDTEVYNSTLRNNTLFGITAGGTGIQNVRNNLSCGNGSGDYGGTYDSFQNSASCDTSGTIRGLVAAREFVDSTSNPPDLHIKQGAVAIDNGRDFVNSPVGVKTDIDNYDRDAAGVVWDLGADELLQSTVLHDSVWHNTTFK